MDAGVIAAVKAVYKRLLLGRVLDVLMGDDSSALPVLAASMRRAGSQALTKASSRTCSMR